MRLPAFITGVLAGANACGATILFQGVISAGGLHQFALQNVDAGISKWCKPGEAFSSLTIVSYDDANEKLVCRSADGTKIELPLSVSRVRALPAAVPGKRYAQVFLSDDLREKLRVKGESEADIYQRTLSSLHTELGRQQLPQERAQIQGLIAGFKAGLVRIYCTEGKPLRYEDAPAMRKEVVDRINQLQGMTLAEVQALIEKRKAEKQAAAPSLPTP